MESITDIINGDSCAELKFRIDLVPVTTPIVKAFPVLDLYPEFKDRLRSGLELDLVLRYIMILYQERSPLWSIDDFNRRKVYASIFAPFPKKDSQITEPYKDIIAGRDKTVNRMIIRFCRMQRNADFTKLVVYENALYHDLELMNDAETETSIRQKLIANIDNLTKVVDDLTASILAGDQTRFLIEDLLDEIELGTLDIKPEDVAKKLKVTKDPVEWGKYYGESYRFPLYVDLKNEQE